MVHGIEEDASGFMAEDPANLSRKSGAVLNHESNELADAGGFLDLQAESAARDVQYRNVEGLPVGIDQDRRPSQVHSWRSLLVPALMSHGHPLRSSSNMD